jgi:hypothetical protein
MIIHGDCMSIDPALLQQIDVQISDYPYSPRVHESAVSTRANGAGVVDRDFGFACLSPELRTWGARAANLVRRWSVIFSDFEGCAEWRADCEAEGVEYVRTVPWIRWSQPQVSGDRPGSGREEVQLFHRQIVGPKGGRRAVAKHWNGTGGLTHFAQRCMRGDEKHKAQKPLDLMLAIVSAFSDPGELVGDFVCGVGTTALACRLLDRECVAWELNATWAKRAAERESAPLSKGDRARAEEWCELAHAEALTVPEPKSEMDRPTWERAQRRIADVGRVLRHL